MGSDTINEYIKQRAVKAANATINRELSLLRHAFYLGAKAEPPKVARVPRIPKLAEDNVRAGFFERADYQNLMATLPESLRALLAFGYYTGCRRGEILGLRWEQVDLIEGLAVLNPGETKNSEGRIIPLAPDLLELLRLERARRDNEYPESPWVFTHDGGRQWTTFKASWATACKSAGLWDAATEKPTKLFHDLRRSGVRNLLRAGVPEKIAQAISGHKTRAVFDRYNIVTETDLKDAARKLGVYETAKQKAEDESKVPASSHTLVTQKEKATRN